MQRPGFQSVESWEDSEGGIWQLTILTGEYYGQRPGGYSPCKVTKNQACSGLALSAFADTVPALKTTLYSVLPHSDHL